MEKHKKFLRDTEEILKYKLSKEEADSFIEGFYSLSFKKLSEESDDLNKFDDWKQSSNDFKPNIIGLE